MNKQIISEVQPDIEVDFPYLNYSFTKTNFVREIILLHLFPYMLDPTRESSINRLKAPIFAKTSAMILREQSDSKQRKFQIDALSSVNTRNSASPYFAYKLEFDELQNLGGVDAILHGANWSIIEDKIRSDITYLFSIYAVTKLLLKHYSNKEDSSYSYNDAFRDSRIDDSKFNEFCLIGDKAIEENAWKRFKYSSYLIYGYIEALYANNLIPQIPDDLQLLKDNDKKKYLADLKKFMHSTLADTFLNIHRNCKYLDEHCRICLVCATNAKE